MFRSNQDCVSSHSAWASALGEPVRMLSNSLLPCGLFSEANSLQKPGQLVVSSHKALGSANLSLSLFLLNPVFPLPTSLCLFRCRKLLTGLQKGDLEVSLTWLFE